MCCTTYENWAYFLSRIELNFVLIVRFENFKLIRNGSGVNSIYLRFN